MSLRLKIAVAMAALAGIVVALAATGAYVTAARQLESGIDDTLVTRARAAIARPLVDGDNDGDGFRDRPGRIGTGSGSRPRSPGTGPRCPGIAELQSLTAVQLIDDDGNVEPCLEGGATIATRANDLAIAAGTASVSERPRDDDDVLYHLSTVRVGRHPARVVTMAFPGGGAIQMARDLRETDVVLDRLSGRLAIIALAGVAMAAFVGFVLASRIVRPIRHLTSTAEHIATTRDLSTPVPGGGNDEIGSLSASFTTMVASLAESRDQQQRLISDASHEMRTPLTSLRTNLELLERAERAGGGTLSAEDRNAVISDLRFETGELTTLLTELVELATDRSAGEPLVDVDLAALCQGVAERARRRTGRTIELTVAGPAPTLPGRQHMLERAVSNLIDNAVKYSPTDAPIDVVVEGPRIEVRDHGPGIAEADLPRIFDRFYRATEARTQPGSGLGLAIVAQIAENHGGRVFAANRPDGATVGFDLTPHA